MTSWIQLFGLLALLALSSLAFAPSEVAAQDPIPNNYDKFRRPNYAGPPEEVRFMY